MEFRKYIKEDKEELINFFISIGVYEFEHGEEWIEYFKNKNYDCYLENGNICYIVKNKDIIASCGLRKIDKNVAEFESFYIDKKYRGTNLSSALYETVMKYAKEVGYKEIILCTHKEFDAAIHFYEKRGFKLFKTEINQGNLELYYRKRIDN